MKRQGYFARAVPILCRMPVGDVFLVGIKKKFSSHGFVFPDTLQIPKRHLRVANAQIGGVYPLEFTFHW